MRAVFGPPNPLTTRGARVFSDFYWGGWRIDPYQRSFAHSKPRLGETPRLCAWAHAGGRLHHDRAEGPGAARRPSKITRIECRSNTTGRLLRSTSTSRAETRPSTSPTVAYVARVLEERGRCLRSWFSIEELLHRHAGELRRVVLRRPVELTGVKRPSQRGARNVEIALGGLGAVPVAMLAPRGQRRKNPADEGGVSDGRKRRSSKPRNSTYSRGDSAK